MRRAWKSPNQLQLVSMLLVTLLVFVMIVLGRGKVGRLRGLLLLAVYAAIMFIWTTS